MPAYEPRRRTPRTAPAVVLLTAAALLGTSGAVAPGAEARAGTAAGGAPAAHRQARAHLPAPTGPYAVGTTSLHLVDPSREDPWVSHRPREVMVSLWYPAAEGPGTAARAPHMEPLAAAHFGADRGMAHRNYQVPAGSTDWAATPTHAREDAPALRGGPRPVVLYSAGLGDPRTWNTGLVEDLASRGFVVVTVDHTYEASEVQFPGGRLAESVFPDRMEQPGLDISAMLHTSMTARVKDTSFVLDRLAALSAGRHDHARPLPRGLAESLDLGRVGMVGQSAGGFTAAQAMRDDPRIKAGINMDGQMDFPTTADGKGSELSPVARDGLDRPFLLMGSSEGTGDNRRSWTAFSQNTRGWLGRVTLKDSAHGAYTDAAPLLPQLARQGAVPAEVVTADIGTVRPERATAATRAYVASFFDRWLRGHDDHLLDGPSPRFPEMEYAR
ncbi:alpha/beta hydrolase family protein [Streptomyces cinnamoneus]|uniref:alpha/beta hydrolase family protein n=1 Tax=Streptomyces cinnamoneus TaxID=53446 RepID=UPI0037A3ADC8